MSEEVSNWVILEKINSLREVTEQQFDFINVRMEEHFKDEVEFQKEMKSQMLILNGQNRKNTQFRERWTGIMIILVGFFTLVTPIIQYVITRKFFT